MMLSSPTAALCARYRLQRDSAGACDRLCGIGPCHCAGGSSHTEGGDGNLPCRGRRGISDIRIVRCLGCSVGHEPPYRSIRRHHEGLFERPQRFCDRRGPAAVLVLEREDRARARGAEIMAEICGVGAVSDTPTLTKPTLRGMVGAMQAAMDDAGLVRPMSGTSMLMGRNRTQRCARE